MASLLVLAPLFVVVAAVYASVGLGGGTGYLALMALFGVSETIMPSISLTLNIVVTATAMLRFGAAGRLRWPLLAPFLISAIPAAFVGGLLTVPRRTFLIVLAVCLGIAAAGMLRSAARNDVEIRSPSRAAVWAIGIPAGIAFGLASGMLGIGGGVFLGPFVLLMHWAEPRETAAMTSAYVLTLSVAGLVAHGIRGVVDPKIVTLLAISVLVGGFFGSHLAETRLTAANLKLIFAVIVIVAAIKAAFQAVFL